MSKKTLQGWNVGEEDLNRLSVQASTAPIVLALSKLERDLRAAPPEIFELLSVLSYVRLGDEQMEHAVQKHIQKAPLMSDFEVILGRDAKDLARSLTNIYLATRYVDGEAHAWLKKSVSSPYAALMLALALANASAPKFTYASGTVEMNVGLLRLRRMDGVDMTIDSMIRAYPILVLPYLKSLLPNLRLVGETRWNGIEITQWLSDPRREAMMEWAAGKLLGQKNGEAEVPAMWKEFYQIVSGFSKLPLKKWSRLKSPNATLGELVWLSTLTHAGTDLLENLGFSTEPQRDQELRRAKFEAQLHALLTHGISRRYYTSNQAAFIIRHLITIGRVEIEPGPALRGRISVSIGQTLAEMVRLTAVAQGETEAPHDPEPEMAAPELPAIFETPEAILPDTAPLRDSRPEVRPGEIAIEDFLEEKIGTPQLDAETIYVVSFRRGNDKFEGDQRFRFGPKVLKAMAGLTDVHPLSWLGAIKMGIARDYAQRGLKILGAKECARLNLCDNMAFKVKVILSTKRIYGHIVDGVWEMEFIDNDH